LTLSEFYGQHAAQIASPFILSEISLPKMAGSARSVFRHLAQLPSQEPIATAAISLQLDGPVISRAVVALARAVPKPQRLYEFEQALTDSSTEFNENSWRDLCETGFRGIEFASDHQRSAGYLREMSGVLLRRTYLELLEGDG
jgi:CO/xanthine dehydrogenase FAD-binding subunit